MLQTKLGNIWFKKSFYRKYSVSFRNFIRSPQTPGQKDEPLRYFAFGSCHAPYAPSYLVLIEQRFLEVEVTVAGFMIQFHELGKLQNVL